ncbi:hypothetical protein F6455_11930 [Proteobacteria bacterium 005FR1]|nr:hypothetical protein [Proteobacteria bacterium 005FR1]
MKKPSAATNASLQGAFGRVYIGTSIFDAGWMELESEQNVITFDGAGSLDSSAAAQYVINRNVEGVTSSSSCQADAVDCAAAESGISYTLNSDGSFGEIGGATGPNIFVNDDFDFLAGTEFFAIDEDGVSGIEGRSHSLTVMVKLPTTGAPTIGSKVYRVIQVENEWNSQLSLNMARPSSLLTMAGETQGSPDLTWADLDLDPAQAPMLVMETGSEADVPVSVSVASNGAATFTATDGAATLVLEGFFNEDASFGVFQTRMNPTGGLPSALGLAVLIEVTQ